MTIATQIATALRELAPDKRLAADEVPLIDALAAKWAARSTAPPAERESWLPTSPHGLKDETAFYAALRGSLFRGGLTTPQLEGVQALLRSMAGWSVAWAAYGFATPFLETDRTMQPIKEYGGPSYFKRMYDIEGERPAKARELGNIHPGDGVKFCGRGYVQLTGRTNYARASSPTGVDLIADPDAAMRPDVAAKILVWGMQSGAFTGKGLRDYLPERLGTPAQFVQARRIINGQDRSTEIARFASQFQDALQAGGWQ